MFSQEIIEEYTEGYCAVLAEELSKRIPGSVIYYLIDVSVAKRTGQVMHTPIHAFLGLPDGRYVDITGVYPTVEPIVAYWRQHAINNMYIRDQVIILSKDQYGKPVAHFETDETPEELESVVNAILSAL